MTWSQSRDLFEGLDDVVGVKATRLESDVDLARRLLYVAGDGGAAAQRIAQAHGTALDAIAESLGLRRR